MNTILVGRTTQLFLTVDRQPFHVHPLFIFIGARMYTLHDCLHFADLTEIEIRASFRYFPFLTKKLYLPKAVADSIVRFLNQYHAKRDLSFDCYSFANMVGNVPQHEVAFREQFWVTRPLLLPSIGDVVFLTNEEVTRFHAAAYIGTGLYLSVLSAGGDLEVATLEDMKRDFRAPHVLLASPKIQNTTTLLESHY